VCVRVCVCTTRTAQYFKGRACVMSGNIVEDCIHA
jgi:hypothetical protein